MASNQNSPWWARDKKASLESRIKKVQQLNDPQTNADELLKGSKMLLVILLCFTGLLGAISYVKFFSTSFPYEAAIIMALALTVMIEWGKNYCFTWSVRIPFFRGWGHIADTRANTIMWGGLLAIAVATFYMSFINSTRGGKQLSIMLSQEKNQAEFQPNTASIDSLIGITQKNIDEASTVKWKGITTRTSQQSIKEYSATLSSLNQQREDLISQQRADWELRQAQKAENNNFAANLVLASGGWVELLQILLILVRVACEKALDSRLPSPTPSAEEPDGIGFRRRQQPVFNSDGAPNTTTPEPRRPIGFFRDREPDKPLARSEQPAVLPTVPAENAVEQPGHKEQSGTVSRAEQSNNTTSTSIIADVKEWQKRATQCFHRALQQQREEYRQDNWQRCTCFCNMLKAVGVGVTRDDARMILEFTEPKAYRTDEAAIAIIQEQKDRLEQITKNRKAAK